MIIVADSSPLISFAVIDKLDLLDKVFDGLIVPPGVYEEVVRPGKIHSVDLQIFLRDKVRPIKDILAVSVLRQQVDFGEAEAIVLALENGIRDILIDDYKGRQTAHANGLFPIGTIGVLLQSRKKGFIPCVRAHLDVLISHNIRISKDLYFKALELAGEA